MKYDTPTIPDRVIAGLSYLTSGFAGFAWLIICVVRGKFPERFLSYHIAQSIFLFLCYVVINAIFWFLVNMLSYIPVINRITRQLIYIFNHPVVFGYSFMQCLIYGILLYLAVFAFMGLYSYLPWVSDIIMYNVKR